MTKAHMRLRRLVVLAGLFLILGPSVAVSTAIYSRAQGYWAICGNVGPVYYCTWHNTGQHSPTYVP